MSKPEFGTKFTCEGCGERFYDLNRLPSTCFKCGVQQSPPRPRMARPVRGASGGGFGRRPLPAVAEEKLEPADTLAADDAADEDAADDDAIDEGLDDDEAVEIEVDIDPDDGKVLI